MSATRKGSSDNASDDVIEDMFESCGYTAAELDATIEGERDVLGLQREKPNSLPPIVFERALAGFADALAALPKDRRTAYDEALRKSPRVVQLESPPERFLRVSEFNFWTAAERVCDYWLERKRIFGSSRYHLPLKLTPGGALSEEAMDLVHRGVATILPPDKFNRAVFYVDRENATDDWHGKTRLEIFFYILQAISEGESGLHNGWIGVLASPSDTKKVAAKTHPDGSPMKLVQSGAIPIKIKALHLLALKKSSFPQVCLNLWLTFARSWNFLNFRIRVHQSDRKEQLVQNMSEFGFSEAHLPERYGGTADSHRARWYEQRLALEKERYAVREETTQSSVDDPREISTNDTGRDKQQLKRRLDALREMSEEYTTERELARLLSEVSALATQNSKLKNNHGYLEMLGRLGVHVVHEYENEREVILDNMTRTFSVIVDRTSDVLPLYQNARELPALLANWMLTHSIVFLGRDPATRERLFSRKNYNSETTISVKDDENIPGIVELLQHLQLALQGKVALEESLGNMNHVVVNEPVETTPCESKPAAPASHEIKRDENRSKRRKLLRRL